MALTDRHPDAERMGEFAEGRLGQPERADLEQHLADCEECRTVLAETIAFLDEEQGAGARTPDVRPFPTRRWVTGVVAALAAAAIVVLAVRAARPEWLFGARTDRPELQELVAALAKEPRRPVEGRLTGGFLYAPPPASTRGTGERELAPDVRVAIARIQQRAGDQATTRHQHDLAIANLVLGRVDEAVAELESAATREPLDASIRSDLAAVYLARSRSLKDGAPDLSAALRNADDALRLAPRSVEAAFNRALVLGAMGRHQEAASAWRLYRSLDQGSAWARESESLR